MIVPSGTTTSDYGVVIPFCIRSSANDNYNAARNGFYSLPYPTRRSGYVFASHIYKSRAEISYSNTSVTIEAVANTGNMRFQDDNLICYWI